MPYEGSAPATSVTKSHSPRSMASGGTSRATPGELDLRGAPLPAGRVAGRRSYAFCLWHYPIILLLHRQPTLTHWEIAAIALPLTLAIAAIS